MPAKYYPSMDLMKINGPNFRRPLPLPPIFRLFYRVIYRESDRYFQQKFPLPLPPNKIDLGVLRRLWRLWRKSKNTLYLTLILSQSPPHKNDP